MGNSQLHFMRHKIILLLILLLAFTVFPASSDPAETALLLIGNSLTYWNDLPKMIESMINSDGQRKIGVTAVAFPNFSLEDHWNQGDALQTIRKKRWTFVILQQGPSASTEGRETLIDYTLKFSEPIRASGAKPALYSVWPSRMRSKDMVQSIESYRIAAERSSAILLPVGEAWRVAWELDPALELYGPDGLHPSKTGSYLASLVICQRLFGGACRQASRKLEGDRSTFSILERAATKALGK